MHFIKKYLCGAIHSQCRCPGPKHEEILNELCPECTKYGYKACTKDKTT